MKNLNRRLICIVSILLAIVLIFIISINVCFRVAFRKYYSPNEARKNYTILRTKIIKTHKDVSLVTYRLIFSNPDVIFDCGVEKIDDFIFYSEPNCINYLVKDFKAYSINDAYEKGIVTMEDIKIFHDANTKYINSKYYFDPYPNDYMGPIFHFKEVKL